MFKGKVRGFGQRFDPPKPSGEYERSAVNLGLIGDDIRAFRPLKNNFDWQHDPSMRIAVSRAYRAFKLPKPVQLLHLNEVFQQDLPISSTSPGLPWMQQGYKQKKDIKDDSDAITRVRWFWRRIKEGERKLLSEESPRFGYPATITFGEAVFALPLIREYQKGGTPLTYEFETGHDGCAKLMNKLNGGKFFLGIDFKSFDKCVPEWLIRVCFEILFLNLNFLKYEGYGVPRFDAMMRMWDAIIDYFVNTPIRICNGERYQKRGGIPSGSYFTQLVGSIANYILLEYAFITLGVQTVVIKVFDDHSLVALLNPIYPSDVAKVLAPFGMIVNTEKSHASRHISDVEMDT